MAVGATLLLGAAPALQAGDTTRVSVNSMGVEGNGFSTSASISTNGNGRYVAFRSQASNLVPGDTNHADDCFVHDQLTGLTTRVSVDSAGAEGNDQSFSPSISATGRFVAFESLASNLVAGDGNGTSDVFVHDLQTGLTTRVSVDSSGAESNGFSFSSSISGNGRSVAFASSASNLVPGDGNGLADIFVHDLQTGLTTRVSVDSAGAEGNGSSQSSSISDNGRYVAFDSLSSNLVPGDGNGQGDVFVHDRQTGLTTRVSVDSAGAEGNLGSGRPSISDNGSSVAFVSNASNLVPGDGNGASDIFVHDRKTGLTTRVSVDSAGAEANNGSDLPSISGNGRFVAFASLASNLAPGDVNGVTDVFVHDQKTGLTTQASVDSAGVEGNLDSSTPSISGNGRSVAFESLATNLVPADGNGASDCFVHDLSERGEGEASAVMDSPLH
jgi:tricorn protease-like protein